MTGGAMGYYFSRVTGSPIRMPYQVNRAAYGVAPYFVWQISECSARLPSRRDA